MDNNMVAQKEGGDDSEHILLKVMRDGGPEVHFRVKMATQMKKLKEAYAAKLGKMELDANAATWRFLFDGKRIVDSDTPKNLEMEDGDVIEVFQEMSGGGWY